MITKGLPESTSINGLNIKMGSIFSVNVTCMILGILSPTLSQGSNVDLDLDERVAMSVREIAIRADGIAECIKGTRGLNGDPAKILVKPNCIKGWEEGWRTGSNIFIDKQEILKRKDAYGSCLDKRDLTQRANCYN